MYASVHIVHVDICICVFVRMYMCIIWDISNKWSCSKRGIRDKYLRYLRLQDIKLLSYININLLLRALENKYKKYVQKNVKIIQKRILRSKILQKILKSEKFQKISRKVRIFCVWNRLYVSTIVVYARDGAALYFRSRLLFAKSFIYRPLCPVRRREKATVLFPRPIFFTATFFSPVLPRLIAYFKRCNCSQFISGMQSATQRCAQHPQSPNTISSPIKHRRPCKATPHREFLGSSRLPLCGTNSCRVSITSFVVCSLCHQNDKSLPRQSKIICFRKLNPFISRHEYRIEIKTII